MEVSIENTADFEQKLESVLDSGNSPKVSTGKIGCQFQLIQGA